jgi:hypothetical protein
MKSMKHCLPAAFAIAFIGAAIMCAQSQAQPQEASQQADVVTVIKAGKLVDTDAGAVLSAIRSRLSARKRTSPSPQAPRLSIFQT